MCVAALGFLAALAVLDFLDYLVFLVFIENLVAVVMLVVLDCLVWENLERVLGKVGVKWGNVGKIY